MHILTLAEVSDLFETYYSGLEKYHWTLHKGDIKKVFIQILKDVKENGIYLKNETELNTFLQIRISTYSISVDNILIDSSLYKRYNPIITDLVNRKLWDKQLIKEDTQIDATLSEEKPHQKSETKIKEIR